jgi:CheY-like chemotaxis protein
MEGNNLENKGTKKNTLNVLLVEDEPLVRYIHRSFLENLNCTVHCAENGKEALEMLKKPYDIVFMDMGLPDISGTDVVKTYRSTQSYHLPIIALTAYDSHGDQQKFIAAGVDEVIVKPVTEQTLSAILAQHSGRAIKL